MPALVTKFNPLTYYNNNSTKEKYPNLHCYMKHMLPYIYIYNDSPSLPKRQYVDIFSNMLRTEVYDGSKIQGFKEGEIDGVGKAGSENLLFNRRRQTPIQQFSQTTHKTAYPVLSAFAMDQNGMISHIN